MRRIFALLAYRTSSSCLCGLVIASSSHYQGQHPQPPLPAGSTLLLHHALFAPTPCAKAITSTAVAPALFMIIGIGVIVWVAMGAVYFIAMPNPTAQILAAGYGV